MSNLPGLAVVERFEDCGLRHQMWKFVNINSLNSTIWCCNLTGKSHVLAFKIQPFIQPQFGLSYVFWSILSTGIQPVVLVLWPAATDVFRSELWLPQHASNPITATSLFSCQKCAVCFINNAGTHPVWLIIVTRLHIRLNPGNLGRSAGQENGLVYNPNHSLGCTTCCWAFIHINEQCQKMHYLFQTGYQYTEENGSCICHSQAQ